MPNKLLRMYSVQEGPAAAGDLQEQLKIQDSSHRHIIHHMSEISNRQDGCCSERWMRAYLCITSECLPQVKI